MFSKFEIYLEYKPALAAKQLRKLRKPTLRQFSNNYEIKFKQLLIKKYYLCKQKNNHKSRQI